MSPKKNNESTRPRTNMSLDNGQLESLINSMPDGVLATDEHANILLYNGAALDVLDINAIQRGESIDSVLKIYNEKGEPLNTREIVTKVSTKYTNSDYKLHYTDESIVSIYLSISPVHYDFRHKDIKGFVLIIRDISREKALEEERDEFISVISHELRTPVAIAEGSVGNALYMVEKNMSTEQIKQALKSAHDQTLYLEDMINDLSTLSRAERGVLEDNIEEINAHQLVESLVDSYEPEAKEKGLKLHADIDPSLSMLSNARLYVQEILQNFITNAIKYTEKGSVTIIAKQAQNGVEFAIEDTGIGISKSDQAHVYDKFFRSDNESTRKQSGTGLGLHVTRKLAQLAKAKISLESSLGKGSTFKVFFPNLDKK